MVDPSLHPPSLEAHAKINPSPAPPPPFLPPPPTLVIVIWSDCSTAAVSLVRMEGTALTVMWVSLVPVLLASPDLTVRVSWFQTHALIPHVVTMEPVYEPGVAGQPSVSALKDMLVRHAESCVIIAESLGCCVSMGIAEMKVHLQLVCVIRGTRVDAAD